MQKTWIVILLVVAGAFFLSMNALSAVAPWEIQEIMDKPAPEFTLSDLRGRSISLADFKNKVVIINFWATWCPPCKAEMPSLNKLYLKFKDSGLVVIAISLDRSVKDVQEFLEELSLDFIILHDPETAVSKKYKVFALPTSFLIDRQGILKEKFIGEVNWLSEDVLKVINRYLKK